MMKRLCAFKIFAKYHLYGQVYTVCQLQLIVSLYIAGPKKTTIGLSTNIHQAQMTAMSLCCAYMISFRPSEPRIFMQVLSHKKIACFSLERSKTALLRKLEIFVRLIRPT